MRVRKADDSMPLRPFDDRATAFERGFFCRV